MIFGRKKRRPQDEEAASASAAPEVDELVDNHPELDEPDLDDATVDDDVDGDEEFESEDDDSDDESDDDESDDADETDDDDEDEDDLPSVVDHSLRDDGPFDITEVDLEADEVDRFDFGALIVTPTEGQLDIQVDQASGQPFAVVQKYQESAIEVALFAAPAASEIVSEQVAEIAASHQQQGATATISEGAFGDQVHTSVAVTTEDGREGYMFTHWLLAQGPKWLLRGRIMGAAGFEHERDEEAAELLEEFFRNIVVRRGNEPMVPGELIPLTLPESLLPTPDNVTGADSDDADNAQISDDADADESEESTKDA